jgi:molybdopterin molybdotransferase
MTEHAAAHPKEDVRLIGFATRATLAAALSWIEHHTAILAPETIPIALATHRAPAVPVRSRIDRPDVDRAARDGYAVLAADTEAADAYTPLPLRLAEGGAWRQGNATLVASGDAMPHGTDAVLPFEAATPQDGALAVMVQAAPGAGVRRRGSETPAGREILAAGRRIRAGDTAFLAALGVTEVDVVQRPTVAVVVIGPKPGGPDLLGPALLARIGRDGGTGISMDRRGDLPTTLADAAAGADLVIVVGRSGCGADDDAAPALRAAGGTLALHGMALLPGGSTGLGQLATATVLLLPGDPPSCLAAYEMLAAQAVRRSGGMAEPACVAMVALDRRIVSPIGVVELVFVRLAFVRLGDRRATPLAPDSLVALHADGYVLVPETSEGFAAGSLVPVYPFDPGAWTTMP